MELNQAILAYEAAAHFPVKTHTETTLCFAYPRILQAGELPEKGCLYLCRGADVPAEGNGAYFFAAGTPEHTENVLLSADADLLVLTQCVYAAFQKYEAWDMRLLKALSMEEPILEMARASRSIFRNPVAVMDRDFHMLSDIDTGTEAIEPSGLCPAPCGESLPIDIVSYFKADPAFTVVANVHEPFMYHAIFFPKSCACANLFGGEESYIARIVIMPFENENQPIDLFLLRHLAVYMELCFKGGYQSRFMSAKLGDVLCALLETDGDPLPLLPAKLPNSVWHSGDAFLWLVLTQTDMDVQNNTTRYTCRQIEHDYVGTCAFPIGGHVAVLVNLSAYGKPMDAFLEEFLPLLATGSQHAGVSRSFTDFALLRPHYRQADIALSFRPGGSRITLFDQAAMPYLLRREALELPPLLWISDKIRTLIEYDKTNGTSYIETLRHYLDNQMNIAKTTRELFIHRSTMLYRLSRIEKLAHIDWNDAGEVLYLRVSLQAVSNTCPNG